LNHIRYPFLAAILLMIAGSCATYDRSLFEDPSIRIPPDPLKLSIACEPFFIRVDVNRNYAREESPVMSQKELFSPHEYYEARPYSELCVDFGNGLMMDYNGNLFIELGRFFGVDESADFSLTMNNASGSKPRILLRMRGGEFDWKRIHGGKILRTVRSVSNVVIIKNSEWFPRSKRITVSPGEIALPDQPTVREFAADSDTVMMNSFPRKLKRTGPDEIEAAGIYKISRTLNSVGIVFTDQAGIVKRYTFFKIADGCVFDTPYGDAGVIRKTGNLIRYYKNGEPQLSWTINTTNY